MCAQMESTLVQILWEALKRWGHHQVRPPYDSKLKGEKEGVASLIRELLFRWGQSSGKTNNTHSSWEINSSQAKKTGESTNSIHFCMTVSLRIAEDSCSD